MWVDPIVQEVRDAGEELAKRAHYDLHILVEQLRENEKKSCSPIVSRMNIQKSDSGAKDAA
jgi:hypothetical protein